MLSRDDVKKAIVEGRLKIYPFNKNDLTGIGYNLSTTNFALSLNRGLLLTLHKKFTSSGVEHHVTIPGNDTVLFFTKEYIEIDNTIAGTFHSKVARACQGLGHISTTLDPTWKGQLIISVNNPRAESIDFNLDKDGNLLTMLLHELKNPVTGPNIHDNNQGRCDLLLEHFAKPTSNKNFSKKDDAKYHELQEFIAEKYANSLNGDDDFLRNNNERDDKFTKTVSNLLKIKQRLNSDKVYIMESRYVLKENGEYKIFKDDEEVKLVKNCSLFDVWSSCEDKDMVNPFADKKDINKPFMDKDIKTKSVIKNIEQFLNVINYELASINHVRRIEWQKKHIKDFAGEESEIVIKRRNNARNRLAITIGAWIVAIIIAIIILFNTDDNTIYFLVVPVVLSSVIPICAHAFSQLKELWAEYQA